MNKKIIIAAALTFFLGNLSAKLPENPGISVIDGGSGAVGNSPLISAIFNTDTNKLVLEMGGVSYYDTPIFDRGEQLTTFFCGGLIRAGQSRFSLSMTSLNAFDLYSESNICGSFAITFARILHFGVSGNYLLFQSEGDYISGAGAEISGALGNRIIMGVFSYSMRNIGDNEYNPVIQEMKAVVRTKENRFGYQAAALKMDDYNRRISAELVYGISLLQNLTFGVAFVPKPFVIKCGLVLDIKNTRAGAAFSLHNALGLSKYLALQYLQ